MTTSGTTHSETETETGQAEPAGPVDLIAWFADNGRDLPWRHSRDPWAITVAELMLQQTQVARVIDRWVQFLDRFPTVTACAQSPVAEVIDEWAGLGYNRRAVNLHRMATSITNDHDGRFPTELPELLALPGIGPYTARAIRAFAHELPAAVLDTNVARILARVEGRTLGRAEAQRLADLWAENASGTGPSGDDPWTWNQAMLDVGAGHCRARNPVCETCPFKSSCRWMLAGRPDPDPAVGSAAVSGRQSRFEGSDRQGRGRLIEALRKGTVAEKDLAEVMGWPEDEPRARKVSATVVADGLAERTASGLRLPGAED